MNIQNQKFPWSYPLTPENLKKWRKKLGLRQSAVSNNLGIHVSTYRNYERGVRYDGNPIETPKYIGLACASIALGLENILKKKALKEWRIGMKYTQDEAATALGMSKMKYINHERGHRGDRVAIENPEYIALACTSIEHGITEYHGPET